MCKISQQIKELRPDNHLCLVYETEAEHRAVLTPFLRQGLESGDKVIYIVEARTGETILGYLRDDVDADAYVQSGQMEILGVQATFMRKGIFNPESMIQSLRAESDKALAASYHGLRISCEMSWALRGIPGSERLIEYEARLNDFLAGKQCLAICQYDRRRFASNLLLEVMTAHPRAVIGKETYDNCYYITPKELLGPDPYSARLTNLLRNLQNRKWGERNLDKNHQRVDEALRQAQETLCATLKAAPAAAIDSDVEGGVKSFFNATVAQMLGWHSDRVLGRFLPGVPEDKEGKKDEPADFCGWVRSGKLIMGAEVAQWRQNGSSIEYSIFAVPQYGDHGKVTGNRVVLLDTTEWKVVEQNLRLSTRALKAHSLCNEALMRTKDEPSLLQDICRIIVEVGEYNQAWVGLLQDDDSQSMQQVAWHCAKLSCGDGQAIQHPEIAIATGKTYITRDLFKEAQFPTWQVEASLHEIASAICLPLELHGRTIGALTIEAQEQHIFDADEIKLLEGLSGDLSLGINALRTCAACGHAEAQLQESVGRVRKTIIEVVQAMALTLEIRDPYTGGHQRRVTQLAVAIAEEMGLDKDRIEGLRVAGFMHDIGKIAVPAEILSKPSKLSEYEFGIVKGHAQVGYEILSRVSFPWPVAQIVLQHHENLDGSGYPQGLKGDDILPEARILTVADVVEAMASHRPYRPALGIKKALQEITVNRDKRYDPEVVDTCVKLFTQKGFHFE